MSFLRLGRLLLIIFFCVVSACQTINNETDRAWANLTLEDSGTAILDRAGSVVARMRAVQAAKVDLYLKLERRVLALKMGSGKSVSDLVQEDEALKKRVSAFVKGAKIVQTQNEASGVSVMASLYLGENFRATLGLKEKKNIATQDPSRDPSRSR